jgi:hypothetical protein
VIAFSRLIPYTETNNHDVSFFYCPYIPLTLFGAENQARVNLKFLTRYDIHGDKDANS